METYNWQGAAISTKATFGTHLLKLLDRGYGGWGYFLFVSQISIEEEEDGGWLVVMRRKRWEEDRRKGKRYYHCCMILQQGRGR